MQLPRRRQLVLWRQDEKRKEEPMRKTQGRNDNKTSGFEDVLFQMYIYFLTGSRLLSDQNGRRIKQQIDELISSYFPGMHRSNAFQGVAI